MSSLIPELLRSLDLQLTIGKVNEGAALDFAQYSLLRESADAKLHHLLGKVQGVEDPCKLQEACMRVSHLLQTSCLAMLRLQLDCQDQQLAREALEGQLACMQACLQRSLACFDSIA